MVAMAIYSVTVVSWKETAFLLAEPWKGVGKGMLYPGYRETKNVAHLLLLAGGFNQSINQVDKPQRDKVK